MLPIYTLSPQLWRWLVIYFSLPAKDRNIPTKLRAVLDDTVFVKMPRIPKAIATSESLSEQAKAFYALYQKLHRPGRQNKRLLYPQAVMMEDYELIFKPLIPPYNERKTSDGT